jgi:D-alanine-D-alanine ligase
MPDLYEVIPLYITKEGRILTSQHLRKLNNYHNLPLLEKMAEQVTLPASPASNVLTSVEAPLFRKSHSRPFDVLFPCFHGGVGEGGWIQGLAEYYQIPLVGTGLTGAALGMDKVAMKAIFSGVGIKQAPYLWFSRHDWKTRPSQILKHILATFSYPIFVKPSRGGSSIGTTCVNTKTELTHALDLAAGLDTRLLIEQGITGAREINVSIMGNAGHPLESSICEEVFHEGNTFLNFSNKYLSGGKSQGMANTDRQIPAHLQPATAHKIQVLGQQVFNLLDCAGLVRIDFLVKGTTIYCIEINTIPGSLSFYLWEKSGYSYPQLLDHLIQLALARHTETQATLTDFVSPILSNAQLGNKLSGKLG